MTTQERDIFFMPIIAPPESGESYTSSVLAIKDAVSERLKITLSNEEKKQLYAMSDGLLEFFTGAISTADGVEPRPGSIKLKVNPNRVVELEEKLPPGIPLMTEIHLGNINEEDFRNDLNSIIQGLTEKIFTNTLKENGLNVSMPRVDLEAELVRKLIQEGGRIYVQAGTKIGKASLNDVTPEFTLLFKDGAGNDLSPIGLLKTAPSFAGEKWKDHPLTDAVKDIPTPVDFFVQFEVWKRCTSEYEILKEGNIEVELRFNDDDTGGIRYEGRKIDLGTGIVHFSSSDSGDAQNPGIPDLIGTIKDLHFVVKTEGIEFAGHTLPEQWSTVGWNSVDGKPGNFEEFAGTRLGDTENPLTFRIGLDFHVKLKYKEQDGTIITYPAGVPFELYQDDEKIETTEEEIRTDENGEIHGITFNIETNKNLHFRVYNSITLLSETPDPFETRILGTDDLDTFWDTSINDIDRQSNQNYFVNKIVMTSLGSFDEPCQCICTLVERSTLVRILKIMLNIVVFVQTEKDNIDPKELRTELETIITLIPSLGFIDDALRLSSEVSIPDLCSAFIDGIYSGMISALDSLTEDELNELLKNLKTQKEIAEAFAPVTLVTFTIGALTGFIKDIYESIAGIPELIESFDDVLILIERFFTEGDEDLITQMGQAIGLQFGEDLLQLLNNKGYFSFIFGIGEYLGPIITEIILMLAGYGLAKTELNLIEKTRQIADKAQQISDMLLVGHRSKLGELLETNIDALIRSIVTVARLGEDIYRDANLIFEKFPEIKENIIRYISKLEIMDDFDNNKESLLLREIAGILQESTDATNKLEIKGILGLINDFDTDRIKGLELFGSAISEDSCFEGIVSFLSYMHSDLNSPTEILEDVFKLVGELEDHIIGESIYGVLSKVEKIGNNTWQGALGQFFASHELFMDSRFLGATFEFEVEKLIGVRIVDIEMKLPDGSKFYVEVKGYASENLTFGQDILNEIKNDIRIGMDEGFDKLIWMPSKNIRNQDKITQKFREVINDTNMLPDSELTIPRSELLDRFNNRVNPSQNPPFIIEFDFSLEG